MIKYLVWHYTRGLKNFFIIWQNYLEFFWHFFSIELLFQTLFYPWRRDLARRSPGFDFKEFFETLLGNLLSRVIGFFLRTFTILVGLGTELAAVLGGLILLIVWLIMPLIVVGLIIGGLTVSPSLPASGLLDLIIALIFSLLLWIFYSSSNEPMSSTMTLEEMFGQPWFNLVWERANIDPTTGRKTPSEKIPQLLEKYGLTNTDFKEIVFWVASQQERRDLATRFWLKDNLSAVRGVGKDWAYGYTINLDKFSEDLSLAQPGRFEPSLIGRENEVKTMERLLVKTKENNILIVGEPGTGRKTIVRGLAVAVAQGKVLPPLKHKRVLELDISAIVASAKNTNEIEGCLRLVLDEAVTAGNIILVIDELQNFVGGQANQRSLGVVDISNLIIPYLKSRNIQLIGIASYDGFHKHIETNTGLLKFFEKMEVLEANEQASLLTLEDMSPRFEKRTSLRITYQALKEIVSKATLYANNIPMPERAIKLLDEVTTYVATQTADKILKKEHVDLVLSEKTKIPIGKISQNEIEKLTKLEDILHQRVIDQEEAIREIAAAMRRARLGIGEKKKPIGSFLFLGPTGVGKTETAKALAEAYFGQENMMVRLDMSEYQNSSDINRLIGTTDGQTGYLTNQIRENPFALLLLDEVEKTHTNILNLFLQILDEGWLTDALGHRVSFRNNIIIATSNAGTELIREMVSENIDPVLEKEKIMDYLQRQAIFRPEFLNRFDAVVVFHPLSKENLIKIAGLLLNNLIKRLAEQRINLVVTATLAEKIADIGYSPEYGARPMKRAIQNKIENLIAQKMLEGKLKEGDTIEIGPENI